MPRFVLGTVLLVGAVVGLGCGDDGGGGGILDAPHERTALCTAALTVTGTFTPAAPVDPTMGCQPAGTWNLTVATADAANCTTVHTNATYKYTVTGSGRNVSATYTTPASGEEDLLTIAGDNAQCTGNFEHVLSNGSQFDQIKLHPRTPKFSDGGSDMSPRDLTGDGEYDLWATHP